jgi:hypothetical protein
MVLAVPRQGRQVLRRPHPGPRVSKVCAPLSAFPDPEVLLSRLEAWLIEVRRHEKIEEEEVLEGVFREKARMLQESEGGNEARTAEP